MDGGGGHGKREVDVAWAGEAGAVEGGHACSWGMELVDLVIWVGFCRGTMAGEIVVSSW